MRRDFEIGENVILYPYKDMLAIVRGIYESGDGIKYECSWFDSNGSRLIEFFFGYELRKNNA